VKGIKEFIKSYGKTILFFVVVIIAFSYGMSSQTSRAEEESMKVLEDSLYRATVQCYAIESRYPPSVEYLEQNYGVFIDHDKYQVFYNGFASNLMPDITVITLQQGGSQ